MRSMSRVFSIVCFLYLGASSSLMAQSNRTAVSVNGNDANFCSTLDPCRSFNRAISQTNSGGEVVALDSGGYGAFVLDRPVTVQAAPGVYAGVTAPPAGAGVDVNVTGGAAAILRGLSINAIGTATGILMDSNATVIVDNCFFTRLSIGINQTGADSRLTVTNSRFILGGDGVHVETNPNLGLARASIDACHFLKNGSYAVVAVGNARIHVSHTVASENFIAFSANNAGQLGVEMNIEHSIATFGSSGMYVSGAGLIMRVSNSASLNHANIGFGQGLSALFYSRGNNTVQGNSPNIAGTITPMGAN